MTPETIASPHSSKECQLSVLKREADSRACKLTRVINSTNQITMTTLTNTTLTTKINYSSQKLKCKHSNSFYKLQRIVAYMLRFCYKGYRATTTTLCTKELDPADNTAS
ncbi:hypothetical protein ACLKA6_001022 [Drosophila palustris]